MSTALEMFSNTAFTPGIKDKEKCMLMLVVKQLIQCDYIPKKKQKSAEEFERSLNPILYFQ